MTDLTTCDREPIHIPGAILPYGAMLVLDGVDLQVLQAAGDTEALLGLSVDALLGQPAERLFSSEQVFRLRGLAGEPDLVKPRHLLDPQLRISNRVPLDASAHRVDGGLVLEFEAAEISDAFAAEPLAAVQLMVEGFGSAASLYKLCQLATESVRHVARYDRVMIYRFMEDGSGWVIAESRDPELEPFLDLHYPAADIPKQARALYLKSWLRLIARVDYDPAPLVPEFNPRSGKPLDMSYAVLRDVSPVHREYLRNMGVGASMSISIIVDGRLWGLIACHHNSPRQLPRHLRAVCELFGSIFSLQIEAREKSEQFAARLASRAVLQKLMVNLANVDSGRSSRWALSVREKFYGMARPSFRRRRLAGESGGGRDGYLCAWRRPRQERLQRGWAGCVGRGGDASQGKAGDPDCSGGEAFSVRCRDGGLLRRPSSGPCVRRSRP
jgi:light-regulated signal transduction histidine kinase (bacteriophytochrome)